MSRISGMSLDAVRNRREIRKALDDLWENCGIDPWDVGEFINASAVREAQADHVLKNSDITVSIVDEPASLVSANDRRLFRAAYFGTVGDGTWLDIATIDAVRSVAVENLKKSVEKALEGSVRWE